MWKKKKVVSSHGTTAATEDANAANGEQQRAPSSSKREIPYGDLIRMTEGFSTARHVGKGSFGDVFRADASRVRLAAGAPYAGRLPAVVAVKRDIRTRSRRSAQTAPVRRSESSS